MKQKTFLFIILILLFLPIAKAGATHVYVGVEITASSTMRTCAYTGCTTDNNWCLAGGLPATDPNGSSSTWGVQLSVKGPGCHVTGTGDGYAPDTGGVCNDLVAVVGSGTSNPPAVGPASPVCPGSSVTIWSGLLNLNSSSNYVMKLYTRTFCPGIEARVGYGTGFSEYCYVMGADNENCNEICATYGLVPEMVNGTCTNHIFGSCSVIAGLKGSPCAVCNPVSGAGGYNYYDSNQDTCYYTATYSNTVNCTTRLGSGTFRACSCRYKVESEDFYFPLQTPASF